MNKEDNWKQAFSHQRFKLHVSFCAIGVAFIVLFLPYFFNEILLLKPGSLLNDALLARLQPKDWSWEIFGIIYASIFLTVLSNYSKPYVILLGVESYIITNLFRIITLYFFTLEPPEDIIPLIDPLITKIAYGDVVYLKDLFFSGHVSTLFLLFLIEEKKIRKLALLLATIIVAFLILWQHVHYSVDVLFAPVFTGLAYYSVRKLHPYDSKELDIIN